MEIFIFILVLLLIALGNHYFLQQTKKEWNNGICAEYDEPWVCVGIEEYTETWDYKFKCRDKILLVSASMSEHIDLKLKE